MGTRNFKSKQAYRKWLAYGHMHVKDFGKTPEKIKIKGKPHKVHHAKVKIKQSPERTWDYSLGKWV